MKSKAKQTSGKAQMKTEKKKKTKTKVDKKSLKKQKEEPKVNLKQMESQVRGIIAEVLEVDKKKITPNAKFVEDLGMDSMRALEILATIETVYKIQIPEEMLPKMVSYNEVMKLTGELLSKKK